MNRFTSLVDMQHFDAQNYVKRKDMQFTTIRNTYSIKEHFKKLPNEI